MIRRLVAEVEAQEFAQTQAVGQTPRDAALAADALAVANQKCPEIHAWRDARPALHWLVEAFAELFSLEVEPALVENRIHPCVERMRRRFGDLFRRHPQLALLRFPSPHRHTELDVSNILKVTCFGRFLPQ